MKRRRDRILLFVAASFSLLAHSALLYLVMSMPIGMDENVLFADTPADELALVPISRAADDLIVDDARLDMAALATAADAALGGSAQLVPERMSDRAPAAIDPARLATPAAIASVPGLSASPAASQPVDPRVEHQPRPAAAPQLTRAKVLDATARLLTAAAPALALPEFTAETDTVVADTPVAPTAAPHARIDIKQLRKLESLLAAAPAGSRIAAGASASGAPSASTSPLPAGMAPAVIAKAPPAVAAAAPRPEAPRLPARLPDPPPVVLKPAPAMHSDKPVVHLDEDFDYELRTLPELPAERGLFGLGASRERKEPGWFEVRMTPRRSLRRLTPLKKDVIYVLDTSESVSNEWVEQMRRGVSDALETLNPGDRFNIVIFKDSLSVLSQDALLEGTPENKAAAQRFLKGAESSGWTDINRALGRLIVRQTEPDRVYQLVMLTDGIPTRGEVDAREIINLITRENDGVASIFAVAVGDRTNGELLEFLTYRNKGFVVYPTGVGAGGTAIRELAARLRYPVVKDAQLGAVGVDAAAMYPRMPRDMYQGQSVLLYGRYDPAMADRLSVTLGGTNGTQNLDLTFTVDFDEAQRGDVRMAQAWGFWKLHHLYSEMIRGGVTDSIRRQMDELKSKYKLKTAH